MKCSGGEDNCGGPWANQVYSTGASGVPTPAPKANAVGCFKDAGSRVMKGLWTHSAGMTNAICQAICLTQRAPYAATQAASHCFCGDMYSTLGEATNCNLNCKGKPTEKCGGAWANQVYEIPLALPCPEQREQFKVKYDIPVEPEFTDDCKFLRKQCNDESCWCVKDKSGAPIYGGIVFPVEEEYDCSSKPKKCLKKRLSLLLNGEDGWIPTCNKKGKYHVKQCNSAECWCVKSRSGKEKKNTRTSAKDSLKC